jgi:hypothetical protein
LAKTGHDDRLAGLADAKQVDLNLEIAISSTVTPYIGKRIASI